MIIRIASLSLAIFVIACDPSDAPSAGAGAQTAQRGEAPRETLIPRAALFTAPDITGARISPDGQRLAWLAPAENDVALWVAPSSNPARGRVITTTGAGAFQGPVTFYEWAGDNTHVVYLRSGETPGAERAFSANMITAAVTPLSPPGTRAKVAGLSFDYPDEAVIAVNDGPDGADNLYRVDLATGARRRILENTGGLLQLKVDTQLRPRLAASPRPDGGAVIKVREPNGGAWRELARWSPSVAAQSRLLGFDASNAAVLAIDTISTDAAALARYDVATGERTVLAEFPGADIDRFITHPATLSVDAISAERLRREWITATPEAEAAITQLKTAFGPDFFVTGRSLDDRLWTIFVRERGPYGSYYLYDRTRGDITALFGTNRALERYEISIYRKSVIIPAKDGLGLIAHLSLPMGANGDADAVADTDIPLVVIAPPELELRFDAHATAAELFLVNRGYGVLAVNPRGWSGFGAAYAEAGVGAWPKLVAEDLIAAAQWAVKKGVADSDRIAVAGQGLGGFAAITAAGLDNAPFLCAAGMAPVTDLDKLADQLSNSSAPLTNAALRRQILTASAETGPSTVWTAAQSSTARVVIMGVGIGADIPEGFDGAGSITVLNAPTFETFISEGMAALELGLADCLGGTAEPVRGALTALDAIPNADAYPSLAAVLPPSPPQPKTPF